MNAFSLADYEGIHFPVDCLDVFRLGILQEGLAIHFPVVCPRVEPFLPRRLPRSGSFVLENQLPGVSKGSPNSIISSSWLYLYVDFHILN